MSIMHVMIKAHLRNPVVEIADIPKKFFKFAAKEHDEYVRLLKREAGDEFERSDEARVAKVIFDRCNALGFYKDPNHFEEGDATPCL